MDELELLAAAQDALKAALVSELGGITVDLGFPATLLEEHVWIEGNADGEPEYDLSNGVKSSTSFTLTVSAIEEFAADYDETRARLKVMWDAVTQAVLSLAPSLANHVEFGKWSVREGRTPAGTRQLGFFRDVDLFFWLG